MRREEGGGETIKAVVRVGGEAAGTNGYLFTCSSLSAAATLSISLSGFLVK